MVFVATEGDQVYALNESTGAVIWQAGAGTPVPSSMLPCGDISPTVGITSTPVIDTATGRIFVVADTLTGSTIQHRLYAFNISSGTLVSGYPMSVEPPEDTPADQLQRPALALDDGEIVIGFGGNDGDCGTYNGWLVGASESGGAQKTFEVDPGHNQGAIWGAGDGPAVDAAGNIWAASGNGDANDFGYQESVLKLAPSLSLTDWWAPSNWSYLDQHDIDLGSSEPLLLPGGLVFQIGKAGVGYLLNSSSLGHTGAAPRYSATVCSGDWGGAIYYGGVIYVSCSDGLRALSLDTTTGSFSTLSTWQVPSSVNGPPIESGGLIWATNWNGVTLYGLNPQTGQANVTQSTPAMDHFATPSASDGKVFLATGDTVEAYTAATAVAPPVVSLGPGAPRCTLRKAKTSTMVLRYVRPKHSRRRRLAFGTLALTASCTQAAKASIGGTATEKTRVHHRTRTKRFRLRTARVSLRAARASTVRMRIPLSLIRALQHHATASGRFTLTGVSAGRTGNARLKVSSLRLARRP